MVGFFSEEVIFTHMFSGLGFYSSRQHITHMVATLCFPSISLDPFWLQNLHYKRKNFKSRMATQRSQIATHFAFQGTMSNLWQKICWRNNTNYAGWKTHQTSRRSKINLLNVLYYRWFYPCWAKSKINEFHCSCLC